MKHEKKLMLVCGRGCQIFLGKAYKDG
jgi:hypothetical protein